VQKWVKCDQDAVKRKG